MLGNPPDLFNLRIALRGLIDLPSLFCNNSMFCWDFSPNKTRWQLKLNRDIIFRFPKIHGVTNYVRVLPRIFNAVFNFVPCLDHGSNFFFFMEGCVGPTPPPLPFKTASDKLCEILETIACVRQCMSAIMWCFVSCWHPKGSSPNLVSKISG